MSKFRMDGGTVIDTDKVSQSWEEATDWDGSNRISKATGSQWTHQTLYKSRKGRYRVLHTSQMQGSREHVERINREEATRWLSVNEHDLPEDLVELEEEIVE